MWRVGQAMSPLTTSYKQDRHVIEITFENIIKL